MVIRRVLAPRIDFGALRRELGLPETYPEVAQREADEAAAHARAGRRPHGHPAGHGRPARLAGPGPGDAPQPSRRRLPGAVRDSRRRRPRTPGRALEDETWRRGQTVYLPDGNVPLHPRSLGEGAASLLPDVDRAAVLWTIDLDADGGTSAVVVQRALVRSRAQLAYPQVQADAEAGRLPEPIALLPEIGALLTARGLRRGAVNLPIPEQDVEADGDGWRLVLRHRCRWRSTTRRFPCSPGCRRRPDAGRWDRPAADDARAEAGGGAATAGGRRPAGRALAGRRGRG